MKNWKTVSNGKSALMIDGARRIGKSTIAEEFAKNEYEDYLIIDFAVVDENVKSVFEHNMADIGVFFRNLFLFTKHKKLPERNSVIIFDEVQKFPLARQAIKYLVKDGRYDYIETGSLITIKKSSQQIIIPSEEEKFEMYPMDFEEFLWASGDTISADIIKEAFAKKEPLGERIHRNIFTKFRTYIAVGGMPQAVEAFTENKTYDEIDRVKRNILKLYEEDLAKIDSGSDIHSSVVFKTIPQQLSNHNSLFRFSKINENARYRKYVKSVSLINDSMVANCCRNVTNPEIALELFAEDNIFKLYMGDTGLLVTQILKTSDETENEIYRKIVTGKLGVNLGMIYENVAAQMLRVAGHELFFHQYTYTPPGNIKEQKYEVDFIIVRDGHLCPIEVKSSNSTSHVSFDMFTKKYKLKIKERFIIYTKDLKRTDNITYLPIYMTMCL